MKSCAAILLLVAFFACSSEAVISDRLRMLVRPRLIECGQKYGISASEQNDLIVNNLNNGHSYAMEQTCLCFYKAVGMTDDKANILPISTAIRFSLGDSPIRSIRAVRNCRSVRGTGPENQAWLINKCFVDNGLL